MHDSVEALGFSVCDALGCKLAVPSSKAFKCEVCWKVYCGACIVEHDKQHDVDRLAVKTVGGGSDSKLMGHA